MTYKVDVTGPNSRSRFRFSLLDENGRAIANSTFGYKSESDAHDAGAAALNSGASAAYEQGKADAVSQMPSAESIAKRADASYAAGRKAGAAAGRLLGLVVGVALTCVLALIINLYPYL